MAFTDHRDLVVWQKAMDLVQNVYGITKSFPREEVYGLTSQMRRAAVSIPCNIAEGHARRTTADFLHFLSIARGSLKELETQVLIGRRLGYVNADGETAFMTLSNEVSRLTSGLANSFRDKTRDEQRGKRGAR